jgi:hypothetical protein
MGATKTHQTFRLARTCYDHLGGRLGVALADALVAAGRVKVTPNGPVLTRAGWEFFENFGVELGPSRRAFCSLCQDGTEGKPHLGGIVGAALLARCLDLGWVKRAPEGRALIVTEIGRHELVETFGLPLDWEVI